MRTSGLAVALEGTFFGPENALVGAIFSLWQSLAGMGRAGIWGRAAPEERETGATLAE